MLSINTNLSSLIAQSSIKSSTQLLNQAVERMSTGYKINHAKDNAANYSIAENMSTKLSAYDIAADNVAMGMDLVSTAEDIISNMQNKASRLHALSTQARNGTYGAQSMQAINSEAAAIMAEINRLYSTAEYNKISLFNNIAYVIDPSMPKAGASGFIDETSLPTPGTNGFIAEVVEETPDVVVTNPADLKTAIQNNTKIGIANAETLAQLATLVNDEGVTCSGKTIILTEDIDLSAYSNWRPIGNDTNPFSGTFNGNGHTIKNLTINRPTEDNVGLFGYAQGEIKNVGLVGGTVVGNQFTGCLMGGRKAAITNCYATGNVTGQTNTGGLAGYAGGEITNSYATGSVAGQGKYTGGLVGRANATITNSYATGNVTGQGDYTGGLVGWAFKTITNSYATGNVTGQDYIGGLVGIADLDITNCYASGDVTGQGKYTGGLASYVSGTLSNSYATGNVTGQGGYTGGLVGVYANADLINKAYSTGNVTGSDVATTGSFIGYIGGASVSITNCQVVAQDMNKIGDSTDTAILANITDVEMCNISTTLQVGINGDSSNQINFDTNFEFDISAVGSDISSDSALVSINNFITLLSDKATMLGAVSNRLESALDSISVNIENLTSSRSTIKDADIAEVSSEYIRQQILQQASATLLSTANQMPSIALQLI